MTRLNDLLGTKMRRRWERFIGGADESSPQASARAPSFGTFGSFGAAKAFVILTRDVNQQLDWVSS